MAKVIVRELPDGSVVVEHPTPAFVKEHGEEQALAILQAWGGTGVEVNKSDLPKTKTNRKCWKLDGREVVIDQEKKARLDAEPKPETELEKLQKRIEKLENKGAK